MDNHVSEDSFEAMVPVAIRLFTNTQFQKLVAMGQNRCKNG